MAKYYLFLLLSMPFFTGCASNNISQSPVKLVKRDEVSSKQIKKFIDLYDKQAGMTLEKRVEHAIRQGKMAVRALSSELFTKAMSHSLRGNPVQSTLYYQYLVKLNPSNFYIKEKYAIELIRNSELGKSIPILKEVLASGARKEESLSLILGGVYTAIGKMKEAQDVYKNIVQRFPKSEEGCVFYSKTFVLSKLFKRAIRELNKCRSMHKGSGVFSYYMGKVALENGDDIKAKFYFRQSLKDQYTYYQAALALGVLLEEDKKFLQALKTYKHFLKKVPENRQVLSRVVEILFSLEKYDEVISYAENLSNLDPSNLNLKVRLGILYTDKKDYKKAKEVFEEVLITVPNSDKVLYYLASLYQQTGHHESAIEYFSKIAEDSELFPDAYIQIARIMKFSAIQSFQKGDLLKEKKFISFVKNNSLNDKSKRELYSILADYFDGIGDVDRSIEAIENIKEIGPLTKREKYFLASMYEKNKEYDAAVSLVKEILEENPKEAHALNFLGYSYLDREIVDKYDDAYQYILQAVKLVPDDGFIRDSLGWYYYKVGRYEDALRELKKAWELVKTDVTISRHIAMVYKKLKSYSMAKKFYLKALENCRVDTQREQLKKEIEFLETLRLPASLK